MVDICFCDVCQKCISKLLLLNWTSGNKYIDKLRNIKYLAHGGFSTIYNKRPTTEELHQIVLFWYDYYPKDYGNKSIDIPSNEQITKNHLLSCYTSRKIEYSAKINEILSQEELSTKFIIDEKKGIINEITLLSENLACLRPKTGINCLTCISKLLQPNWTSGNLSVDKKLN
ncbi:hypothetical protein RhiirC2_784725 [Rhizophagus irregularis]|uniref:Uncharacterized protein n=1 Tax=Rhizophagus irregularis TaxID=588596 RepID=A0A2N1MXZ5_9GLOM|nr:hypothetical protein RhiirC2_784725 [Rhizophagus irregularis]